MRSNGTGGRYGECGSMCRSITNHGFFSRESRSISGCATSFRFCALGLLPSASDPQPENSMYLSNPRDAGFQPKPTHVVLYPAPRQISASVFTFFVSGPLCRSATTSVPKQSRPVSIDEYAGVVGMCGE